MAKISSPNGEYPIKPDPEGGDKVIGTDVTDDSTKNFTVQGIADFATDPANTNVVNSVTGLGPISTNNTTGNVAVLLDTVSGVQGTYQNANVTVDQYGRIVSASTNTPVNSVNGLDGDVTLSPGENVTITPGGPNELVIASSGGGAGPGGTVTQIDTGIGLDGGPITTTGTISLADQPDLTPGSYTNADIVVDAQGRIVEASNGEATPDQDLQSVLDTGNTAVNSNIVLTGTSAVSVPTGLLIVQTANLTGLATINQAVIQDYIQIQHELQDSSGATGTYGQVLISDPTYNGGVGGVLWTDQTVLRRRVSLGADQLNSLTTSNGVELIPSAGLGIEIHVISVAFGYNYNSQVYDFTSDLGIYCGAPSVSTNPQFTLDKDVLNSPFDIAANGNQSTNGRLIPNQPLEIYTTAGTSIATGNGSLNIEITYRVLSV